ncbi:MAG: hypothetical protein D6697_09420 [Armatimonadetes bacterium]|nr:MAG: hypothetical protein D6697_09420 [Armatimonadota bacterium]
MFEKARFLKSVYPYLIGFALARLMEYPIRLVLVYPLGYLFQLLGFISAQENREALSSVHQVYLHEYTVQLRSIFYWSLWLGVGLVVGILTLTSRRVNMSQRVFNGFTAPLIMLGIYGCIIGLRGFPYGWVPMDFIGLPAFIVAQFYTGILFAHWIPRLYHLLAETEVGDLVSRRRKESGSYDRPI